MSHCVFEDGARKVVSVSLAAALGLMGVPASALALQPADGDSPEAPSAASLQGGALGASLYGQDKLLFAYDDVSHTATVTGVAADYQWVDYLIVPAYAAHNGSLYTVTAIGAQAALDAYTGVVIPESVVSIQGAGAFGLAPVYFAGACPALGEGVTWNDVAVSGGYTGTFYYAYDKADVRNAGSLYSWSDLAYDASGDIWQYWESASSFDNGPTGVQLADPSQGTALQLSSDPLNVSVSSIGGDSWDSILELADIVWVSSDPSVVQVSSSGGSATLVKGAGATAGSKAQVVAMNGMGQAITFAVEVTDTQTPVAPVLREVVVDSVRYGLDDERHVATVLGMASEEPGVAAHHLAIPSSVMDGSVAYAVTAIADNAQLRGVRSG